jgi:hypothetical protein
VGSYRFSSLRPALKSLESLKKAAESLALRHGIFEKALKSMDYMRQMFGPRLRNPFRVGRHDTHGYPGLPSNLGLRCTTLSA